MLTLPGFIMTSTASEQCHTLSRIGTIAILLQILPLTKSAKLSWKLVVSQIRPGELAGPQ